MPLFGTFSSASSRALGLRNGSPPSPPTISAPSDNVATSLVGSGNTTNRINTTVSFTSTVTSFAIARFEFKVDQLDSGDGVVVAGTYQTAASAGATSFLLSNLLTSTRYGLYMRTVDVAGLVSVPTSVVRFITAAEVGPTVPQPSLSSTALTVSIGYAAGTAGTYAIGTREYSLHLAGGTPVYVPFTATVYDRPTTTAEVALTPKTSYEVSFRYTASPTTLPGVVNSNTIATASETANSAPTVTINSRTTTNVTFTRGTSSGGTYGVAYYEYVIHNSSGSAVSTGTMSNATTSLNINAGVNPNETFTVYVRARSSTSDKPGGYGSASDQLDPNTPGAPTISFTGMTPSTTGTATMNISKPQYATAAYVNIVGYGIQAATDQGGYFSITLNYQPYNATIEYKAYVINRLSQQSSYGNSIYWNTPKQNMPYNYTGRAGEWILAATNSVVNPACASPYAGITWGYVPPNVGDVGYIRIDYVGVQLKTGGFSNTVTDYLYFSTPAGNVSSSLEANTDASYSLRYNSISVGGSSLSGGTIALNYLWVDGNPPASAARLYTGFCVANGSNWFWAKDFYVQGVTTLPGSGTGF